MDNYNCTRRRNKIVLAPGARFDSLHTAETTQKYQLGTILEMDDATGRMFRYCKAGDTELAPHLMNCAVVLDAEQFTQVQTSYGAAKGLKKFDILMQAEHTITDHELIDGWLIIHDGTTAMGDLYLVTDNYFTTDDTVINMELAEPLRNAILTSDDVGVLKNRCLDVVVAPSTQTEAGPAVGVARCTVAIGSYFWAQYRGYCAMIHDTTDTIVVGEPCGRAHTLDVPGCIGKNHTDGTDEVWGTCVYPSTDAEAAIVNLMLP